MKVKFIADGDSTTVYGRTFPKGEFVDISDMSELAQGKLSKNPAFELEGAAAAPPTPTTGGSATVTPPAEDLSKMTVDQLIDWLNTPPRSLGVEKGQMPKAELLKLALEAQAAV